MTSPTSYVAIVPIKPPARGKSRLDALGADLRAELAAAFARDTIAAAASCRGIERVLVVTDDFRFADDARSMGCHVIPDGVSDDLNETLRLGAAEAFRLWPMSIPVALLADLPCLRPQELAEVLAEADGHVAFVADEAGTGTTLYTAPYDVFAPEFGPGSAAAHLASGARRLTAGDSVRADVDEPGDLGRALTLGVGAETARALGYEPTR